MTTKKKLAFSEEEMTIDEGLGYPKAYAKLCRSHNALEPYSQGPPSIFVPYTLQPQEALRAKDLNRMFPVLDPDAIPCVNPRGYVNILWKQLDHLGNAGFDPALFRVDQFGNVLYLHADSASPLAWDIDHWFPCSRGGKTVPSNLRILQWQVSGKKQNKLDFLIPWWDFQLGISVNQFLSIFASKNTEFRNRAFSFLFPGGGSEELNALQTIDSHSFPQHFIEMKEQMGLAPAALVPSQGSLLAPVLRPLDINRSLKSGSASSLSDTRKFSAEEDDGLNTAIQRFRPYHTSKENDKPEPTNPYLSIVMARDSLRQRDEAKKKQAEINQLDGELDELKQQNETERVALQHLEQLLIKKRRRVEKCRRLSEAQSSYRALLEKMIRDAMHQSVLYKEQLRLNQAATSALMARLEAQRAICDSSEQELNKRFKQRDEIEKQIRPRREHARKRSRTDDTLLEERNDELLLSMSNPLRKELRKFLEEEQKASEAGSSFTEGRESEHTETSGTIKEAEGNLKPLKSKIMKDKMNPSTGSQHEDDEIYNGTAIVVRDAKYNRKNSPSIQRSYEGNEEQRTVMSRAPAVHGSSSEINGLEKNQFCKSPYEANIAEDEKSLKEKLERVTIKEERHSSKTKKPEKSFCPRSPHEEDDDEHHHQVGKGNIEKWLKQLLQNAQEEASPSADSPPPGPPHVQNYANPTKPLEEKTGFDLKHDEANTIRGDCMNLNNKLEKGKHTSGVGNISARRRVGNRRSSMDITGGTEERNAGVSACESSRGFMSFPSSPSVILSMRKGVDCIGRKPKVMGDQEDDCDRDLGSRKFIKTWPKVLHK